ncbi:glutathione S-transferase [Lujinxingia litoralis]|uniref:glutathione transferase n=1 Tax=Lujinxingia litoralis TaxID=2211119 RepID=A0A328C824_9DELT|nr:glutathione S-transferase [Lujinxingia litoralis]RAL21808.1 glutathione S-transferase [Lujinxingia litoralis]
MLTVHHLNNSRSHRIIWLLEELGVDYQIKRYQRDPLTQLAPPELREIHPLGKAPVVSDGDQVLAESGAILEYLVDRYGEGRLRPAPNTPEHLRYTYWMHYAEGSAMSPLLLKVVFHELGRQGPLLLRPLLKGVAGAVNKALIAPQIRSHMDYWEAELGKSAYLVGDTLTAADIQMSFPLEAAIERADAARYPRVRALVDAFRERPAYQRAIARGGEYSLAFGAA